VPIVAVSTVIRGAAAQPRSEGADRVRRLPTRVRRVLLIVVIGQVMAMLDSTIVNVALRSLAVNMNTSITVIQWVVTAYLLSFAAVTPVSGWAAGRFGARRVYLYALALFTVGSLLCGIARTPVEMIAFRVLQGAGGGLLVPVGQALLIRTAGKQRIARVMSLLGVPTVLAPICGPTVGGLLVDGPGWRWVFFVNVPIGVIAVVLARLMLPRVPSTDTEPLDRRGLVLVSAGLLGLIYGLTQVASTRHGLTSDVVIALAGGIVLLGAFVIHSLHSRHPLLSVRLYRDPTFAAASLSVFCIGAVLYGGTILMPLYYQQVRALGATATGLLLAPGGIGGALASLATGYLVERLGSGRTALLGAAAGVVAAVPFGFLTGHTPLVLLGLALAARGAAISLALMPSLTTAYQALAPSQINTATPQLTAVQRVGASLGVALFTVVLLDLLTTRGGGPESLASAYAGTFWWVTGVATVAVAPAAFMVHCQRRRREVV
jgi:EmrB/QacA subfamily drug resistance transporter